MTQNKSQQLADAIHVEDVDTVRKILDDITDTEVVSTIFPTLISMNFHSTPCLCVVLDFVEKMIPRISLQHWVLVIRTIARICTNAEKLVCNQRDELSERLNRIIRTVSEEWIVLEMSSSSSSRSLKYLDRDTRHIYTYVCKRMSMLMASSTLLPKVYYGILEQVAFDGGASNHQRPWSAIDIAVMLMLFSRCDTMRSEMKRFVNKLCILHRFPFKYLSDVIVFLLHAPKSDELAVTARKIDETKSLQGLANHGLSDYSFQHQMSSTSLELLVYLIVMPSQRHGLMDYTNQQVYDITKDVQRLAIKIFHAFDSPHRKEFIEALIPLTSPLTIRDSISAAREKCIEPTSSPNKKRRLPRLIESSPGGKDIEHILRSIESVINESSYSPFRSILTHDENLRHVTAAFEVAYNAYSLLLTLRHKLTWDDVTQRIFFDRSFFLPYHTTKYSHAVADFYDCTLIHLHYSILVSTMYDKHTSAFYQQLSNLTNRLTTMLFSHSAFGPLVDISKQRVAGLILTRCLVYQSSLSSDKKNDICNYLLRFVELTLERALLEPMCIYWIVVFLSSLCFDSNNTNDLLPSLGTQMGTYEGPLAKVEALRQLKILINRIDVIKKVSDWRCSNNHPLDEKATVLAFLDIPLSLTEAKLRTDKRMVLCVYSLAKQYDSLRIQGFINFHHLYWWLRFIHALMYSYLHIGREASPMEWSPEVWVFATLESPSYLDSCLDKCSTHFYQFNSHENKEVVNDQTITHICFSILSLGVLSAVLTNVINHMDYLLDAGDAYSNRCLRLISLAEYQMRKIYALDHFCRGNLQSILEAYKETEANDDRCLHQPSFSDELIIAKASEEEQESNKILLNVYLEIFFGSILFDDQSLWKYLLLFSNQSTDIIISTDDPDEFDEFWSSTYKRSITLRTLIIRHLIQRFEYRRVSDTLQLSSGKYERINITKSINCLVHTIDNLLLILPRLKLIDIYGSESAQLTPQVGAYQLLINSAQLLLLTIQSMSDDVLRSYDGDLFNSIQLLIGTSDDLICSSILLDIGLLICNKCKPGNREGLEYASWEYVSTSHTQYNHDSVDFYLSRVPHSFKLTMVELTQNISVSVSPSSHYYNSLHDLTTISTKRLINCDHFKIFRQKLLLHWGIMKGAGKKLFENLSSLVSHVFPKSQEGPSNLLIGLTAHSMIPFYELLLQMTVTSFAIAKPSIDSSNHLPYQDIQNYLHLFSSVLSYFTDSHKYKEKNFRVITFKLCIQMVKLGHDQLERCIEWRKMNLALAEAGARSSVLSDPLSISHVGSLLEMMMGCVCKITSMISKYRVYATDIQHEPDELKRIKGSLRKIDELSTQNQRLSDHIQQTCVTHSLHASSLELLTVPTRTNTFVMGKVINKGMKRKMHNLTNKFNLQESSSSSISSHSSNTTGAAPVEDMIDFKIDDSELESESGDSFGVVGRWGADEIEDDNILCLN